LRREGNWREMRQEKRSKGRGHRKTPRARGGRHREGRERIRERMAEGEREEGGGEAGERRGKGDEMPRDPRHLELQGMLSVVHLVVGDALPKVPNATSGADHGGIARISDGLLVRPD